MFAVATISSTLCTIKSYLYLHDLCVLVYAFMYFYLYFYVYMGQVPEMKLMMMMTYYIVTYVVLDRVRLLYAAAANSGLREPAPSSSLYV